MNKLLRLYRNAGGNVVITARGVNAIDQGTRASVDAVQRIEETNTKFVYWASLPLKIVPSRGCALSTSWSGFKAYVHLVLTFRENHCSLIARLVPYPTEPSFEGADCSSSQCGPDLRK